ncbi:MAG TPA: TonB family protein [Thermoanaerobaculia bacterium]|jgi:TonB family protein
MAAPKKPYEQFGPFILFKKLETDSHGELWRAGRIDGTRLGPTVALRRFTSGSKVALRDAIEAAQPILAQLHGTSFARDQVSGVIDGVPYIAWDYAGGRSLRLIIDRARGNETTPPKPLPLDQAIVIAEKVALSLATMAELRDGAGNRLLHGALTPEFIWISDDGEIRVAGQQLGSGFIPSLIDAKIAYDIGRYFAMEYRTTGKPTKASEVYALGAVLYLVVTGQEPPDNLTPTVFASAMKAARTMTGEPIPDDIRLLLDKSLNLDPAARYASVAEMKSALSALANGGKYSATTFNLAFYLSNLLKKDVEAEAAEREKEAQVNVAAYLEQPRPAAPAPLPADHVPSPAPFAAHTPQSQPKRSKLPIAIAAVLLLGVLGGGAAMMMRKAPAPAAVTPTVTQAAAVPAPVQPRVVSEPVVVATTATIDPKAQEAAFELAVQQKLKEERDKINADMMRLQAQFTEELKRSQSKNAPIATARPVAAPVVEEERAPSAAQLDQQRRESAPAPVQQVAAPPVAPVQQQQQQPAVTQPQAPAPAVVQPQAVAATVREGDVVDVSSLDVLPRPTRAIRPHYPPLAARQKISATVIVSALISESGEVLDVRVLRGYPGFGINDAAVRAMKSTPFSSPMKDGKRVRTWFPQTMEFKP